jgi:predicted nucleotidyltransferase
MIDLVEQRRKSIAELCRRHEVRRLELFGSAARGDFEPVKSDLDFVVQFTRTGYAGYADAFLDFAEALEKLFGRKVDLLTERMIRSPHFRAAVNASRQVVYEERGETKTA